MKFKRLQTNQTDFYFLVREKTSWKISPVLTLIIALLSTSLLSAQANNYKLDKSVHGVDASYIIKSCNGRNAVFLKFNNKNKYKVSISWKEVFATQAGLQVEGTQGQKKAVLLPGETFEISCQKITQKDLVILAEQVSPTYIAEISKFEFKDITVNRNF